MQNKIFALPAILAMLLVSPSLAQVISQPYNVIGLNFLRSDPVIPQPGENVDVYFTVNNVTTNQNPTPLQLQLNPSFPLKFAPGEDGSRSFANIVGPAATLPIVIKFSLYVDPNATKGSYNAELRYSTNSWVTYNSITPQISVKDVGTDFDVVEQDVSGSTVTLALSNIGSNPASAVTFEIPEQKDFVVQGVSANILGNLNAGDFTLVSFNLKQTGTSDMLLTKVHYTDANGNRRVVEKSVKISFVAPPTTPQRTTGNNMTTVWIIAVIAVAIIFFFVGNHRGKRKSK